MTDQNNAAQAAGKILTYLGFAQAMSMEPGVDRRRDHIQSLIESTQLSKLRAEGVQAGEPVADAQEAFATWWNSQDEGCIQFDLEQYPQDLKATLNNLWNTAWRAALASAPVAGEAQPHDETLRLVGVIADKIEDGTLFNAGIYSRRDLADKVRAVLQFSRQGMQPAAPQASEAVRILFPAHLRKMWSGGEVQAWLDNHQGITPPPATAKGSLERYRKWQAEQTQADKDRAAVASPPETITTRKRYAP